MHHAFDAVIVGSGGSGLYAALEVSGKARTAVLSKVHPVRGHTGAAQGGISAALGNVEADAPRWHAFDTVHGGGRMFKITANAYANTGDGPAICARKGIPLEDMEFFQFHPTGIKGPRLCVKQ